MMHVESLQYRKLENAVSNPECHYLLWVCQCDAGACASVVRSLTHPHVGPQTGLQSKSKRAGYLRASPVLTLCILLSLSVALLHASGSRHDFCVRWR